MNTASIRHLTMPLVFAGMACLIDSAQAQTYSINWFSIDGGGGTSAGGPFTLRGTIGQPDAGRASGGPYTLVGGFWSVIAAIQTPGSPYLSVSQETVSGQVTISWPLPAEGFVLQETSSLNSNPAMWSDLNPPYQTNATDIFITLPQPTGNRFYRLAKP